MTKYWCVNFDAEACLQHGIKRNLWLMQYQYSDDQGNEFQGGRQQAATTRNWKRLKEVQVGDRFVAYLRGNKFFAVGTVISPRRSKTAQDQTDSVDDYVTRKRSHDYDSGCVYYTPAFYEDFTDEWRYPDNPLMRYSQRIDVEEWRHYVPDGISVKGLKQIPPYELQMAVFEITEGYFDEIAKTLAAEHGTLPNEQDGPAAAELSKTATQVNESSYFTLASLKDERERRLREIVQRRGQPEFRNKLVAAYRGRCAVTGCDAVSALEAAHITPYLGPESNHVTNGLLLRADIHTLFDLDLIGIDPESLQVVVAEQLRETCCDEMDGGELSLPDDAALAPNKVALQKRWEDFDLGN